MLLTIKLIHCIKTTILSKVSILPCASLKKCVPSVIDSSESFKTEKINENEDSCGKPVNSGQA